MTRLSAPRWLAQALAAHRKRFPPTPVREASITIVLEQPVILSLEVAPSKWEKVRGLFPGLCDSAILDELVDNLLQRVGLA